MLNIDFNSPALMVMCFGSRFLVTADETWSFLYDQVRRLRNILAYGGPTHDHHQRKQGNQNLYAIRIHLLWTVIILLHAVPPYTTMNAT